MRGYGEAMERLWRGYPVLGLDLLSGIMHDNCCACA